MKAVKGSCSCGDSTYTAEGEPLFMFLCHCKRCQKSSGGPATAGIIYALENVTFDGILSTHNETADSGNTMTIQFCRNCGTTLSDHSSAYPDAIVVSATALEDASFFKPQANCWVSSKPSWSLIDESLINFENNPE